jgi:superfamily II DNA or RNA helicase
MQTSLLDLIPATPPPIVDLYPNQKQAKSELYNLLRQGEKRLMVVAPCGWGKTLFTASILKDAALVKGRRCLFVVPFRTLIEQARQSFEDMGVSAGVIAGNYPENRDALVQIATIQTLSGNRDLSWFDYDVLVLDEAHIVAFSTWIKKFIPLLKKGQEVTDLYVFDDELSELSIHQALHGSPTWDEVVHRWNQIKGDATDEQRKAYYVLRKYKDIFEGNKQPNSKIIIGLTGSPFRLNKREFMSDVFQHQVLAETPGQMVEKGRLIGCEYFTVKGADLSGVHTSQGDFVESEISELCSDPEVVKSAVGNYKKICPDRLFINFAVDVNHAEMLKREFVDHGVNAHIITAGTPDHTRQKLFDELARGEIQGLVSVGCLSVGFDVPNISCVILSRPTLSISLFIQQVGRGMRLAPGKTECIVLDQSGNTKRFGMIESLEYPKLEDEFMAQPPPTKECPECHKILPALEKVCSCGHVFESEGEGKEKVKPVGEMEIIIDNKDRPVYDFYQQKLVEAFTKKYSPDWAVMQVKERFDRYPKRLWARGAVKEKLLSFALFSLMSQEQIETTYLFYLRDIVNKKQSDPKLSEDKKARYNDKWIQKHFYNEFGVTYEQPS